MRDTHAPTRPASASRLGLALLLALLLALPPALSLAGCGGGGSSGGSSSTPAPAAPLSVSAATPSGLTATLAESAATIPVGGSVTYTLTLANNTTQPITFAPVYSGYTPASTMAAAVGGTLAITSPSGATAYPANNTGTTSTGIVGGAPTTLAPGQSTVGAVVTGSVFGTAGIYSATATFTDATDAHNPKTNVGPLTVTAQ